MKKVIILLALLPFTLYSQTRNYDQELADLLFAKRLQEAQSFYAEYKNDIVAPFVIDSYHLISNIHAGEIDSVLLQLSSFMENYYGNLLDDDVLLFFPTFYEDAGDYENGLKVLNGMEDFFNKRQNEESLKKIVEYKKQFTFYSQTRNYDEELVKLLVAKRLQEAQSFYAEYKNDLVFPFVIDFYHLISNIHAGKTDSVFLQLSSFIDSYGNVVEDNFLLFFPELYWDTGDYENGLKILNGLETFFRRQQSEGQEKEETLKNVIKFKNHYRAMSRFPAIEIKISDDTEVVPVPIQTDPAIIFDAQYNQTVLRTVFDTGNPYHFFMLKNYAERAGIKMVEPYSEKLMNGIVTRMAYGIIDSVRIGPLVAKNIPVLVLEDTLFMHKWLTDSLMTEDKLLKADSVIRLMEIYVGTPVIKLFNHVCIDLNENILSISLNHEQMIEKERNMYIEDNLVYLYSTINGLGLEAFIDTGGNHGDTVVVNDSFYEKLYSLSSKENPSEMIIPEPVVFNAGINIGGLDMDVFVKVDSKFHLLRKDVFVGLAGLLKKMKKITFDFKAMRMDCE